MKTKNLVTFVAMGACGVLSATADAAITIGAGWGPTDDAPPAFFWDGLDVPNTDGPFTFNATEPVYVSITDVITPGDQFNIFDNGSLLGSTPAVPFQLISGPDDPNATFGDPNYSWGSFLLGAGPHSITIEATGSSVEIGKGYIRVDNVPDAGNSAALLSCALAGLTLFRVRRTGR